MPLNKIELTDLGEPAQVRELNSLLKEIVQALNLGNAVILESPRPSERSRFGGGTSEGPPKGRARHFRQVPTKPADATYGGRPKTQIFNGKEWRDVA